MNNYKLNLTRTEFSRLMRGYSNQSNKTVDRQLWKRLKGAAIEPNTLGYEVTYDRETKIACIAVHSRRTCGDLRFTTKLYPTLKEFINYIFFENHMGRPIDVSVQGTSSAAYQAKDYSLKTDYMSSSTHNTPLSNIAQAISNVGSTAKTAGDAIQTLTINANDFYESVKGSKISDLADLTVQPWSYDLDSSSGVHNWGTIAISSDVDSLRTELDGIKKQIDKLNEENKKEKKSMFNFDFGKVTSDAVRVSMYGVAVKNVDGRYVSYDKTSHSVMDVEILNMPAGDFLYKMPVAIKDVKAGDVVIHNRVPMFVVETHESTMKVIDIREGTEKEIYLTKSPFGFNFATKVVSLMDMTGAKADESNPFGAMLPFMLMGDNKDFDPMMLMLMNGGKFDMSNPMMMYFLMKDTNHKDLLPLLMMAKA